MKIKMNTLYAGPAGVMEAGSTHTVDDALGQELVAAGYAQALETTAAPVADVTTTAIEPPVETSALTVDNLEKSVKPRPRRKP